MKNEIKNNLAEAKQYQLQRFAATNSIPALLPSGERINFGALRQYESLPKDISLPKITLPSGHALGFCGLKN